MIGIWSVTDLQLVHPNNLIHVYFREIRNQGNMIVDSINMSIPPSMFASVNAISAAKLVYSSTFFCHLPVCL